MNALLIQRTAAAHWYTQEGKPFHEVMKKDGTGMRRTTLADARKVNAYPSVTGILNVMAKPGLEAWKQEQAILASLTLPRIDGETEDAFAARVVTDMDAHAKQAAEFGTRIHDAVANMLEAQQEPDAALAPFIEDLKDCIAHHEIRGEVLEKVVVNRQAGYAGRVDLIGTMNGLRCVIDFKTQKVKRDSKGNAKPAFYESWPLQLAAYAEAYSAQDCSLCSIVIDSTQPGPVHLKLWDKPKHEYYRLFEAATKLWQYQNNYNPTTSEVV